MVANAQQRILSSARIKFEDPENIKQEPPDVDEIEDINLMRSYAVETIITDPLPSTSRKSYAKHKSTKTSSKKKSSRKEIDEDNDHFCPVCDKYFTEARKVKTHVERIHLKKKNFACDLCEYTAYKKYDVFLHFQNVHKPKDQIENKSTCPECGMSFLTNSKLNMHIQRKHQKNKRFGCDICGIFMTTLNEMRIHVKTHLSKDLRESYKCEFCEAVFYSKGSLKNHKDVKHGMSKHDFICFCGKVFKLKSVYQRHFNVVHMGEKRFKCMDCNKAFSVKAHLENHRQAIHTIQTGIPCEKCGLVLKNNETLKKHMIYHDPPKFQCPTCFKMFHENKRLQDHQSAHTTLEFACTYCSQSYRLESQLQRHLKRVHIKEKLTFRCELCMATFTRKSTYRDHALRQHKELSSEMMTEFLQKIKKCIPEEHKT